MAPLVDQLKTLRAELDSLIDTYNDQSSRGNVKASDQAKCLASIANTAKRIDETATPPSVRIVMLGFQRCEHAAVRVGVDLDLFNILEHGDMSLDDLAAKTGADPNMLIRMLRVLVSHDYILQSSDGKFCKTPVSTTLIRPEYRDWVRFLFDTANRIHSGIPQFLASNGYKDMTDLSHNVSKDVLGDNFYEYFKKNPAEAAIFASAMKMQDSQPPSLQPVYPFPDGNVNGNLDTQSEPVYLVDVGGGKGQFLEALLRDHPSLPGRFIVQDLEATNSKDQKYVNPRIEKQAYDFFTPQPIIGAKYYFFRHIMHNWPDEACLTILQTVRKAFKPGYSKLLIWDAVMPATGYTRREALADINVLSICGKERTEEEFRSLLQKAGFRMTGIWKAEMGTKSVVEAELDG